MRIKFEYNGKYVEERVLDIMPVKGMNVELADRRALEACGKPTDKSCVFEVCYVWLSLTERDSFVSVGLK